MYNKQHLYFIEFLYIHRKVCTFININLGTTDFKINIIVLLEKEK